MTNWKETTLDKAIDLVIDHRGLTPKKLGGDWSSSGYRAISAKSIKNGQLVNEEHMNLLPEDLYKKWMKEEVQYGDIFLTSEAPLGEHIVWKSDEKLVLSQRIFGIRTKKGVLDPFFFNYFIDSKYYQHQLKSRESGSTVTGIKQSELLKTKVFLPPIEEQKEIAGVLGSLDDKIELLREENKALEATAQTIFKEWFVYFNFPNTEGKPYKSSGGKMIDSELGKIPDGWKIELLDKFATVQRGVSYKGDGLVEDNGVPMINLGNFLPYKGFKIENLKHYIGDYKERNLVLPGDIVIANTDITQDRVILGSPVFVPNIGGNILYTHHVFALRFSNEISKYFIYHLLQTEKYRERVQGFATGTTVLALPSDAVEELIFAVPEGKLLNDFDSLAKNLYLKIDNNYSQIQTLSTLRDTLLPKLMSGDIQVKPSL